MEGSQKGQSERIYEGRNLLVLLKGRTQWRRKYIQTKAVATTAKISLENAVGHLTMQGLVGQMARDDLSSCLLHGNTAHSWLSWTEQELLSSCHPHSHTGELFPTTDSCAVQMRMTGKVFKKTSKKLTEDFVAFSHTRFRKQLTHQKSMSRHASGGCIQKSETKKRGLSFLTHPALKITAGARENVNIKTEREDGGPVWNYSTITKKV